MLETIRRRILPAILAAAMLIPAAGPAEETTAEPLRITQRPETLEGLTWRVFSGGEEVTDYRRPAKEKISMPAGDQYMRIPFGILTYRGDAFRRNAAYGTAEAPASFEKIWQVKTSRLEGRDRIYSGLGWAGQPVILKWSREIRELSDIKSEKRAKTALKEVIVAGLDGRIVFLDLEDGSRTRETWKTGFPMGGTPSVHPAGFPFMTVGQLARRTGTSIGDIGLRMYNLYDRGETGMIDGLDGGLNRRLTGEGSFETSALIDRKSDTMITAGANGMLYLTSLNTEFDWREGLMEVHPSSVVLVSGAEGRRNALAAVKSSPAMYDRYVFYADMGGIIRCVDTDTLTPMWAADTGDSVTAAVALDQSDPDSLDLYTANLLNNRPEGKAQIRRYDALTGQELWCTEIGVEKESFDAEAGCRASPVIGEKGLGELVYFTVTGLDDSGRETLGIERPAESALVALDKSSGAVRWAAAMDGVCISSPVAVYDGEGRGWIIQGDGYGVLFLLDGLTGEEVGALALHWDITGSPAVYNDTLVVALTGKSDSYICAVRIVSGRQPGGE